MDFISDQTQDFKQSDMDTEETKDIRKIIDNEDSEMTDISKSSKQCQFCTNFFSFTNVLICAMCTQSMCKKCFSKGYWIDVTDGQKFIFKIPEFGAVLPNSCYDYYICSLDCAEKCL